MPRIAEAAHNTILTQILVSIRGLLKESRHTTVPPQGVSDRTIDCQRRIIEAIESRDAGTARAVMQEHLWVVYERLKKL